MTRTATSADGTTIAFDEQGSGPYLVILGGALNTRHSPATLIPLLSDRFTVVTVDRRGRGDSGDTAPYAVEREMEDVRAVIEALGGTAFVAGHSSGGALALEVAATGSGVERVVAYEPPFVEGSGDMALPISAALDAGDSAGAIKLFMDGVSPGAYDHMSQQPWFPGMLPLARTLPYEFALTGDTVPVDRYARIAVPTLVVSGSLSPEWAAMAAETIIRAVPGARHSVAEGQSHNVEDAAFAAILSEFFG